MIIDVTAMRDIDHEMCDQSRRMVIFGAAKMMELILRKTDSPLGDSDKRSSSLLTTEGWLLDHSSRVLRSDLNMSHLVPEIRLLKRCKTAKLSRVARGSWARLETRFSFAVVHRLSKRNPGIKCDSNALSDWPD